LAFEKNDIANLKILLKNYNNNEFDKKYKKFLQELNMEINPQTLRVDLHPVFASICKLNDKGKLDENVTNYIEDSICITRYATLSELYILMNANLGICIKDINLIRKAYQDYLLYRLSTVEEKSQKKNQDKKNDNKKKELILPPRMWRLDARLSVKELLYPIPILKHDRKTNNGTNNESQNVSNNNTSNPSSQIQSNSTTSSATTNTTTAPNTSDTNTSNDNNTNNNSNNNAENDKTKDKDHNEDDNEDNTLEYLELFSGLIMTLESVDPKNHQYFLHSSEEEQQLTNQKKRKLKR